MRQDARAVVLAIALFGKGPASASEPPATQERAQVPGDLRVLAIEQRPGGEPVAVLALRGGAKVTLGVGDDLGTATVISVSLDEATLEVREPLDDPNQIEQWREFPIRQWSSVPVAEMGVAHEASCPTAMLRVEGDLAVFRIADRDGAAAFVRLRAGARICGAWRIECVDSSSGQHEGSQYGITATRGVVILRDASTGRRIALASWRP